MSKDCETHFRVILLFACLALGTARDAESSESCGESATEWKGYRGITWVVETFRESCEKVGSFEVRKEFVKTDAFQSESEKNPYVSTTVHRSIAAGPNRTRTVEITRKSTDGSYFFRKGETLLRTMSERSDGKSVEASHSRSVYEDSRFESFQLTEEVGWEKKVYKASKNFREGTTTTELEWGESADRMVIVDGGHTSFMKRVDGYDRELAHWERNDENYKWETVFLPEPDPAKPETMPGTETGISFITDCGKWDQVRETIVWKWELVASQIRSLPDTFRKVNPPRCPSIR